MVDSIEGMNYQVLVTANGNTAGTKSAMVSIRLLRGQGPRAVPQPHVLLGHVIEPSTKNSSPVMVPTTEQVSLTIPLN